MTTSLKQIVIDKENYEKLKNLGKAGESFNDVITKLLKVNLSQSDRYLKISNSE
ncbi:antitoxin VapB family protein [Candidatus Nitrosocosmicus sp. T]